ncbi:MAG: TraR/DksA family transcriptional regulator [bacterium]
MEKDKLEKIKKHMQETLENLNAEIAKLEESSRPVSPDNAIGRLSRMDAIERKSINESSLVRAKDRKEKILKALKQIDTNEDFGLCSICDEEIPIARLMAVPESSICINCAEGRED